MNGTPTSFLVVGGGLLAGIATAAWSIWFTRFQSRKMLARFPNAEKAQWAIYLVLAAVIYVGFAHAAAAPWPRTELLGVLGYSSLAAVGYLWSSKVLAIGWLLHALWDTVVHGNHTPFVPEWYRWACLSFDGMAAAWIAGKIR